MWWGAAIVVLAGFLTCATGQTRDQTAKMALKKPPFPGWEFATAAAIKSHILRAAMAKSLGPNIDKLDVVIKSFPSSFPPAGMRGSST